MKKMVTTKLSLAVVFILAVSLMSAAAMAQPIACSNNDCVDSDRDGYPTNPLLSGLRDCDDDDVMINSGAFEVPANSVDEDCDGVLQCDPTAPYDSHESYARCVAQSSHELVRAGKMTEKAAQFLSVQAQQSTVGGTPDFTSYFSSAENASMFAVLAALFVLNLLAILHLIARHGWNKKKQKTKPL